MKFVDIIFLPLTDSITAHPIQVLPCSWIVADRKTHSLLQAFSWEEYNPVIMCGPVADTCRMRWPRPTGLPGDSNRFSLRSVSSGCIGFPTNPREKSVRTPPAFRQDNQPAEPGRVPAEQLLAWRPSRTIGGVCCRRWAPTWR